MRQGRGRRGRRDLAIGRARWGVERGRRETGSTERAGLRGRLARGDVAGPLGSGLLRCGSCLHSQCGNCLHSGRDPPAGPPWCQHRPWYRCARLAVSRVHSPSWNLAKRLCRAGGAARAAAGCGLRRGLARVITEQGRGDFLRPSGLLRAVRANPSLSGTALLRKALSPCDGTGVAARSSLACAAGSRVTKARGCGARDRPEVLNWI
jgi:hypothetical protein